MGLYNLAQKMKMLTMFMVLAAYSRYNVSWKLPGEQEELRGLCINPIKVPTNFLLFSTFLKNDGHVMPLYFL